MKKGTTSIDGIFKGSTEIASIYKGTTSVYENGETLETSGVPPLTVTNSLRKKTLGYQVYGNSIQNGTPSSSTPVEIQSVGDLVTDSQDEHYGEYKIPVTVNNITTNIYLDEPLRKIGNSNPIVLPSGYTQLEYIESSGEQYIDTGIKDIDTTKFTYEFAVRKNLDTNMTPVGAVKSVNGTNKRLMWGIMLKSENNNAYQSGYGSTYKNIVINENLVNKWVTIKSQIINNKYKISLFGNSEYSEEYNLERFDTSLPIYLFGSNRFGILNTNYAFSGDISYVKMYLNNQLFRNFIPAKNSNNEIGMYDTVTNTFYTNAGTGTFTAGPQIYTDYIDYKTQKVFRNVVVDDDTGTLPIEESYHGVIDTTGTTIELPDILLNKGTNIISIDSNINASNLWIKYKGKE